MERLVTAADLGEQLKQLDAEAATLAAEIVTKRERAGNLEVGAVLTGKPTPPAVAELRAEADAAAERVTANRRARDVVAIARETRDEINRQDRAAAHAERMAAARTARAAALDGMDDAIRALLQKLAALDSAHDHLEAMTQHARAMANAGDLTSAELSEMLPRKTAIGGINRLQDRKTGQFVRQFSPAETLAIHRQMFADAALDVATNARNLPPFVHRWLTYTETRAKVQAAGQEG